MRYYPDDEYGLKEAREINAPEWMIECLKKNPSYCSWGNHEDYMSGNGNGWDSPVEINSVNELWNLDDLNELVNFYFEVKRGSNGCKECDSSGYNRETKQLSDDWYDFSCSGRRWVDALTQHEVDALWEADRLQHYFKEKPSAAEVNNWSKNGVGHDGINRSYCVEARAKMLGIYGLCPVCNGTGYVYTEDEAHLKLQMWIIHPRKGCGRGVYLRNIQKDEVNKVVDYLKSAALRNANRFCNL